MTLVDRILLGLAMGVIAGITLGNVKVPADPIAFRHVATAKIQEAHQ